VVRAALTKVRVVEATWEMIESGPVDAERTVLLLPGGMCSSRSFAEVMAEPALAGVRMVAVTLPGQAGAPPLADPSVPEYARLTGALAEEIGADVVVGFSMGADVAYEMVVSQVFAGPVVLLALSLSTPDEPASFRALIHLGSVLGALPFAALKQATGSLVKHAALPPQRQAELQADFDRNKPRDMGASLRGYLRWLQRDDDRARRLCEAGRPAWVMHAEKGDGGLTPHERAVLEACPHVRVVTLPGHVFFLPNEAPGRVADLIVEALAAASAPHPAAF
jgi:pimeloyl-ACP methyl ester carboxylesterase